MNKRIKSISVVAVMLMLLLANWNILPAKADENKPNLIFKAVNASGETITEAKPGDEFEVLVAFDGKFNMFDMTIEYDSNIFEYVKDETYNKNVVSNGKIAGKYYFNYTTTTRGGISATSGTLAAVTLKVKQGIVPDTTGNIGLTVTNLALNDAEQGYKVVSIDYNLANELENGIKVGILKGDVNTDGAVTMTDAALAKKIAMKTAASSEYTEAGFNAGDLDGNQVITINEARKIKRVVLNLTTLD